MCKKKKKKKKNYRPASNLSYLSKVLGRVIAKQLTDHMSRNKSLQAAYKRFHSTETTLLKVHNDIMWTMEKKGITILVLLDLPLLLTLSTTLLTRMELLLGIRGVPLQWFKSYLAAMTQRVHIDRGFSSPQDLNFGVPQGSCLGPQLFLVCMLLQGNIIRKHGMSSKCMRTILRFIFPSARLHLVVFSGSITEVHEWIMVNFLNVGEKNKNKKTKKKKKNQTNKQTNKSVVD